MDGRFASPELLQLGRPPALAAKPYETLRGDALSDLLARFGAVGISYDVQNLETDPGVIVLETSAYRDLLRRQQIDDVVAQTYLGSATGSSLDHRAADYGVLRRTVVFANPLTGTPAVLEDDDSLRIRARLAWEALSVAGPAGAYVFHALDPHPNVFDAVAYGPESGLVQPGEVLVVVQSRDNGGVPTAGILDVVADRLDAYETIYADGTSVVQPVRKQQSVRPLGARVTVAAARPLVYNVTATLYVDANGDRETIRLAALANLAAYQEARRRIGRRVPTSGLEAALALVSPSGIPVVDDVDVMGPDVVPSAFELPVPGTVTLTVVPR